MVPTGKTRTTQDATPLICCPTVYMRLDIFSFKYVFLNPGNVSLTNTCYDNEYGFDYDYTIIIITIIIMTLLLLLLLLLDYISNLILKSIENSDELTYSQQIYEKMHKIS